MHFLIFSSFLLSLCHSSQIQSAAFPQGTCTDGQRPRCNQCSSQDVHIHEDVWDRLRAPTGSYKVVWASICLCFDLVWGKQGAEEDKNGVVPLLSLREKFWLWATSWARLNVKCCLWALSSLSTALTVSITLMRHTKHTLEGHTSIWNSVWAVVMFSFHADMCLQHVSCRQPYLPRRYGFTHEDFVVAGELWGVVIHVFHFDVHAHFCVLVVASCVHRVKPSAFCCLHTYKAESKSLPSGCLLFWAGFVIACLFLSFIFVTEWKNTFLTRLSVSQPLSLLFVILICRNYTSCWDWKKKKKVIQPAIQLEPSLFNTKNILITQSDKYTHWRWKRRKKKMADAFLHICSSSQCDFFPTTLSLPDIYSASQGLKVVSMVCNASSFVGGKPIPICPSGVYHAAEKPRSASLQLEPRPQNTRVGPLWPVKRFWRQSRGEKAQDGLWLAAFSFPYSALEIFLMF